MRPSLGLALPDPVWLLALTPNHSVTLDRLPPAPQELYNPQCVARRSSSPVPAFSSLSEPAVHRCASFSPETIPYYQVSRHATPVELKNPSHHP